MQARRCIMKQGSFDNYLLHTKEKQIDSRFGLYLRGLMKQKQQNPEKFVMPYIPGQCYLPRTRSKTNWMYKNVNPIWMPAHVRVSQDHSKWYLKSPSEMSRYELAELE